MERHEYVHHAFCRALEKGPKEWNNSQFEAEEKAASPCESRGISSTLSAFSKTCNSQCQEISDLSAKTTGALADIQIISDLFPHMKEVWFRPDKNQIPALFSCLLIHVTIRNWWPPEKSKMGHWSELTCRKIPTKLPEVNKERSKKPADNLPLLLRWLWQLV